MILIDTGPLASLLTTKDRHHRDCQRKFDSVLSRAVTTVPVLTEAFYLLGEGWSGPIRLRKLVGRGLLPVHWGSANELARAFELQEKYADLPVDFADASLIAAAEALDTIRVFTLDRRDFTTYRIRRGHELAPVEIV